MSVKVNPSNNSNAVKVATTLSNGTHYPEYLMYGLTDDGTPTAVPVTAEGHIEVAIHGPRMPFGALNVESLTPIFQADAVYGVNSFLNRTTTSGTGTVTASSNMFHCATGATSLSFATLQSKKRLRYRPGQGVVARFTALFSTPVASSILVAGVGTGESGFYFGYNGTSFGILHSTGGVREIQTLTVSTGSSTAENITITLGGTAFSVAVTNSGSTTKTAYEIAQGTYTGWEAEQRGATVVFVANTVGDKTGTFSLSGASTAVGSFAETLAGVAATDTWIAQSSWNGDKLDGTGASGVTLDTSKGNVFQIDIQYLGFGGIAFKVEVISAGNNADFVTVHTIAAPNSRTTPTLTQPSFPFTMAAYSAGSTTDVWVKCASYAGFIEGERKLTGPKITHTAETSGFVGSTASTYYPLFTICNSLEFSSRANQAVINVTAMAGAHDDATPVTYYLIENATLVGTPSFAQVSSDSCAYIDTAATSCTVSSSTQLIEAVSVGQNAGFNDKYVIGEIELQPGNTLTLAARAVTGTSTYVNGTLNTREDH